MAITFPLTGSGDATASGRTRNGATRDGTHAQAIDLDPPAADPGITRVATSTTSAQLLAANAARCRVTIVNEAEAILLVKIGTTASGTSYTRRIAPGGEVVLDPPCNPGRIDAILVSGSGNAQVTEEVYA